MRKAAVFELRLGLIRVQVWQRLRQSVKHRTITVARLYRDGTAWKESTRFFLDDVDLMRAALKAAQAWIERNP